MFNPTKMFVCLDELDPRLNIIPADAIREPQELLTERLKFATLLMRILDDDERNPLRHKGSHVIQALEAAREKM